MKNKVALITGVTGQDGAYLSEFLLKKGYTVHGIKRRSSSFNTERIDHIYQDPHVLNKRFILHYGDLTDSMNITKIIKETEPDEIYNLGAQSHVKVSFETPEYTSNTDALGPLRILEAVKLLGFERKTRIYQASTSELYGLVQEVPQSEKTPFYPRSPYAVAKMYAYWITVNYREAYGMHASNGILFNHESPIRGETFVTRKITRAVCRIVLGLQDKIYLGNLSAKRDWGHAKDYIEGMYLILQQDKPDDYVLATGKTSEVREFLIKSFAELGLKIEFQGKGVNEKGYLTSIDHNKFISNVGENYYDHLYNKIKNSDLKGLLVCEVDPSYFRPTEVELLIGDSTKARNKLGWKPKYDLDKLISDMILNDIILMKKESYISKGGYKVSNYFE